MLMKSTGVNFLLSPVFLEGKINWHHFSSKTKENKKNHFPAFNPLRFSKHPSRKTVTSNERTLKTKTSNIERLTSKPFNIENSKTEFRKKTSFTVVLLVLVGIV